MRSGYVVAVASALLLSGCATANYLTSEYGTGRYDGTVTMPDGSGWWIWEHKSRQRLVISVDPAQAAGMGMVAGLTFGGAAGAIPPPIFERVAERWFSERGKPQCRTTRGHPIDRYYYEFDYECPPAAAVTRPKR